MAGEKKEEKGRGGKGLEQVDSVRCRRLGRVFYDLPPPNPIFPLALKKKKEKVKKKKGKRPGCARGSFSGSKFAFFSAS